jgi:hypothetical protein
MNTSVSLVISKCHITIKKLFTLANSCSGEFETFDHENAIAFFYAKYKKYVFPSQNKQQKTCLLCLETIFVSRSFRLVQSMSLTKHLELGLASYHLSEFDVG